MPQSHPTMDQYDFRWPYDMTGCFCINQIPGPKRALYDAWMGQDGSMGAHVNDCAHISNMCSYRTCHHQFRTRRSVEPLWAHRMMGTQTRNIPAGVVGYIYGLLYSLVPGGFELNFRSVISKLNLFCLCILDQVHARIMMASSNGNVFCVTGHLCGNFFGHRWIPLTKASDAELWYFLWSTPEYTVE